MKTAETLLLFTYIYVLYLIVSYNHQLIDHLKQIEDKEVLKKELKVENIFINIYLLIALTAVVHLYFVLSFYAYLGFVFLTFILIWSYSSLKKRIRIQMGA